MGHWGRHTESQMSPLERRVALSGNVSVLFNSGAVRLLGDGQANHILVSAGEDGLELRGQGSTTLNGDLRPIVAPHAERLSVIIGLGGGDDAVTFSGVHLRRSVRVEGGDGDDVLIVRRARLGGGLRWRGGDGDDYVVIRDSTAYRPTQLEGGPGRDRLDVSRLLAKSTFNVRDLSGPTVLNLNRLSASGATGIRLGDRVDTVVVQSSTFRDELLLQSGGGADRVTISASVFTTSASLPAPSDGDIVSRELVLGWDFTEGTQGWRAAFDGYPYRQNVSSDPTVEVPAEEAFELRAGLKSLNPASPQRYLSFSGVNLSDGLGFLAYRRLGTADGLSPLTSYRANVQVSLVHESRAQGDNAFYFVGARTERPTLVPVGPSTLPTIPYAVDFDLGNLSRLTGAHGGYVGTLGLPPEKDPTAPRTYEAAVHLRTDRTGAAWLLLKFSSGFEVPFAVSLKSIRATLAPAD